MQAEGRESALERLMSPEDYQAQRSRVFPSTTSLRWYLRVNRDHLVEDRALVRIAGRLMVDPQAFDAAVIRIAQESAR